MAFRGDLMIKEFCAENYLDIPTAIKNGANRIELCDNLAVGGTTPSKGVIQASVAYCEARQVPVMTMIRPRKGNFYYTNTELAIMKTDLLLAKELKTSGLVFGCLDANNCLDKPALLELINLADGLEITFHMAFDSIPQDKQFAALDWLADHHVTRILTHGGDAKQPLSQTLPHLKELIAYAKGRITILPGGQITYTNATKIATSLGVNEVHGTKIIPL